MKSTKFKTKTEKGITLIALIITIVVLMILAAVAINSITNDGIIGKAESVKNTYTEAQNEEQKMLDYYEALLAGKTWTQSGNKITRGDQELTIGQTISYTPDSTNTTAILASDGAVFTQDTMTWKVLGVNKYGQLELISTTATTDTLTLEGKDGYLNGPSRLNTLCNDLYKAEGKATARSLNVEDINKLAGMTEEKIKAENSNYGTKYTYKYYAGDDAPWGAGIYYIESSKNTQPINNWSPVWYIDMDGAENVLTGFYLPDGTIIDATNPGQVDIEVTMYSYSFYRSISGLFDLDDCWLSSAAVSCGELGSVHFGIMEIVGWGIEWQSMLFNCMGDSLSTSDGVCPVITLNANVELVEVSGVLTVQ